MNVSRRIVLLLPIIAALLAGGAAWGQTTSRIPAETNNWLQVTGTAVNGDPDRFMVAFFEVPDTISEPIYFAVNHPGNTGAAPDTGGTGTWNFHLVGGVGTVTDPVSRQLRYTGGAPADLNAARTGTLIQTRGFTNETGWRYFNAVMPNQGEKIGNRYYFKIVAEAPVANGGKNAFQLDVGFSGIDGTIPAGSSVIRAFAYAWTLNLRQTAGATWDLFPFVTNGMAGNIDFYNWDMDGGESLAGYNRDNSGTMTTALTVPSAPAISGEGSTWPDDAAVTSYPIGAQTSGTWRLRITETNGAEPAENTSMFWFENGGNVLRTYAQRYVPTVSHVMLTPASTTAINGTPVTVTIQAVDTDGAPMPYAAPVRVTAVGGTAPLINGVDADEIITLNADGFATFTISASDGTVVLTPYTDGTGGIGNNFGAGTDVGTSVAFAADNPPTLTQASALSYLSDQAAPVNIPTLTIADTGTANITAAALTGDIRLRFSAPGLSFLNTVTTPTLTVGGTAVGTVDGTVGYPAGVLLIDVTGNFAVGDTLTIGGATPLQLDTTSDVPGTYYLQLSVDGGTNWIQADKAIVVGDPNPTAVWTAGAGTTAWNTAANWSPADVPDTAAENAVIPTVSSNLYPVLPAGTTTVNNLSIAAGASLDVGGNTLTISGVLSNNGTIYRQGGSAVSKTDTDSGTTVYRTAGTSIQDYGALDYYNLELAGALSYVPAGNLAVAGSLSITNAGATLALGTLNLSVSGPVSNIGAVSLDGSQTVTLASGNDADSGTWNYTAAAGTPSIKNFGTVDYFNLTVSGAGTFTAAGDLSVAGAMTISAAAAVVDLGASNLSVTGVLSNVGTIRLAGSQTVTLSSGNDIDSGTWIYDGAAGGTLYAAAAVDYFNLTINGTGTFSAPAALAVAGNLTLSSGTLDAAANGVSVAGNFARTLGALTSTGTVTFNGAGAQAFNPTGSTFANITVNKSGGTLTLGAGLTLSGILTVSAGELATGGQTVSMGAFSQGGGTLTAGASAISVGGNWTRTAGTFTQGTSAVTFTGTAALSSGGGIFYDLTIGAGATVTPQDALTVNRNFVINNTGTYVHNGQSLTLGGVGGAAGNLTDSNAVVQNLGAVTVSTAAKTMATAVQATSLTIPSTLNTGGNALTVSGALTVTGTLNLGGAGTVTVGGNLSLGTLSNAAGSTLILNGAGAQALTPAAQTFGAVSATGTGGVTMTGSATFASLSVAAGETFTAGGAAATTLTVNGAVTNAGALNLTSTAAAIAAQATATGGIVNTGTLSLEASNATATATLSLGAGSTLDNTGGSVQVSASAGTVTLRSASGAFTLTGNALALSGRALSLNGLTTAVPHTLAANEALTLTGAATFSGGLTLNGAGSSVVTGNNVLTTGPLTVTSGTVSITGSGSIAAGISTVSLGAAGTLVFNSSAPTDLSCGDFTAAAGSTITNTQANVVAASGSVSIAGTFDGTVTLSTIAMSGAVTNIATTTQIGHLTLTPTAAVTVTVSQLKLAGSLDLQAGATLTDAPNDLGMAIAGAATVAGAVTSDGGAVSIGGALSGAGSWTAGAGALTIGGDFTLANLTASSATTSIAGATVTFSAFVHNSGELVLNGNSVAQALVTNAQPFNNLTLSAGTDTTTVSGTLTLAGNLSVQANQTLAVGNNILSVTGTTTNAGTITLGNQSAGFTGLVTNTGGTLTGGSGALTLSGGLTAGAVTASSTTTTVGGNFTPATFTHNSGTLIMNGGVLQTLGGLAYNNLTIDNAAGVNGLASSVAGNLTLTAGALSMGANALSVAGNITRGTGTINSTGTVTLNGAGAQSVDFTGSTLATLAAANTGAISTAASLSAASFTKTGAGSFSLGAGHTLTVSTAFTASVGTVALNGPYAGGGATFTVNGAAVTVEEEAFAAGAMAVSSGSFTQNGVNGGAQTAASITVSGTGSCIWDNPAAGGTLAVSGGVTVTAGTLNFNRKAVTVGTAITGLVTFYDLVIPAGVTLTPGASTTITVLRDLTVQNTGAYNAVNSPTLILGGASGFAGSISDFNGTPTNLGALVIDTQAKTLLSSIAATTLDIRNGGILAAAGYTATITGAATTSAGAGTFSASTGGIVAGGSLSVTTLTFTGAGNATVGGNFAPGAFTASTSTVTLNGAAAAGISAGYTFYNLTIDKDAVGNTVTPAGLVTVGGTLTLTRGTWAAGANTLILTTGSWNSSAANFTFTQGTSTVRLDAAAPTVTQKGADRFYNLTLQQGGALGSDVAVDNDFAAANAGSGGTLTLGANVLYVGGAVNLRPVAPGATLVSTGSTLNLNGSGAQTVTSNGQTWNNLTVGHRAAAATVTFADSFSAGGTWTVTGGANAYNVTLAAGGSAANGVTFANTGTLTIAAGFTFDGGATATVGPKSLVGTISATGANDLDFGTTATTISGNATLATTGAGTVTLAGTTVNDGFTLTLGSGAATTVGTGAISGVGGAPASNLTINTAGVVTIGGPVGTDIGTVTVTQSGGTTFTGTVNAATVALNGTAAGQTIAFNDALTVTTGMSAAAGAFNVALNQGVGGQTSTISGSTTLANTGTLTLGNDVDDVVNFNGGVSATSQTGAQAIRVYGAVNAAAGTVTLGDNDTPLRIASNASFGGASTGLVTLASAGTVTIDDGFTLTLGDGTAAKPFTTGSIAGLGGGAVSNLTINTTGAVTVGGSVGTDVGTVTVTQSGGTTFQNTVDVQTLAVADTAAGQTVRVDGNLTLSSGMTVTGAGAYHVSVLGGANSIAGTTTFNNTGNLTVGSAGSTTSFALGAVKTTAGVRTFAGTISSTNQALNFGGLGSSVIAQDTTFSPGTGTVTLIATTVNAGRTLTLGTGAATTVNTGAITAAAANNANLVINTTGVATIGGAVGTTAMGTVTVTQSGDTTFTGTVNAATVALNGTAAGQTIAFNDALTVTTGMSAAAGAFNVALNQGVGGQTSTISGSTTLANTGTLTLGNDVDDVVNFNGGVSATSQTGAQAIRVYGAVNAAAGTVTLGDNDTPLRIASSASFGGASAGLVTLASGGTVTIDDGYTLTLGDGTAAKPFTTGAVSGLGGGAASNLTINTTGAVTVGGAVGSDIGTVTVTQSGGTTFQNTVDVQTLAIADTAAGQTVRVDGNLTLSSGLTVTGAGAYHVSVLGGANSIAGTTTFNNTGNLTVGSAGSTTSFALGAVKTTAGVRTFAGTISSTNQALNFGGLGSSVIAQDTIFNPGNETVTLIATTISAGATLTLGTGAATTVNTGAIDGTATSALTINTTGGATISGAVGAAAMGTVTVTQSGGTTFQNGVNAATVTLTNTAGTIAFNGNLTATTLNVAAAGFALSMTGAVNSVTDAVNFQNTGGLTLGDAATDSFTFTGGLTSTTAGANTFQGTVSTGGSGGQDITLDDLTVGAGGVVFNAGSGAPGTGRLVISGTATVAAGLTLDVGSSRFSINTLSSGIPATAGIFRLTGVQTEHVFGTFDTDSGVVEYYGAAAGTIFSTGFGGAGNEYFDLRIAAGAGTKMLDGAIIVLRDLHIAGGILDVDAANNHQITVAGNWRNDAGHAGFAARQGTVVFTKPAPGPIEIRGNNTWYVFQCLSAVPGLRIHFENDLIAPGIQITQRIAFGGTFRVRGSSAVNFIRLDRLNDTGNDPTNPPADPGNDDDFWFFDLTPGATLDMEHVHVYYSNARSNPVSVPANVSATPYSTYYSFKWLTFLFALYSYTEDTDYNGKIDRIRVTTEAAIGTVVPGPAVDFSDFVVEVEGYEVDRSRGINGYERPVPGQTFYVYLIEKGYLDTGATPSWRIARNESLYDEATGTKQVGTLSRQGGSEWMTPGDTAWPVIGYALTLPDRAETFVQFSEPMVQAGGTVLDAGDFSASSFQRVSGSAPATREALVNLGPFAAAALAAGASDFSVAGTVRDLGAPPYWDESYAGQVIGYPAPTYPPATGYGADPNLYASLPPAPMITPLTLPTRPPFELQRGGSGTTTHRVTDVLVSVPPASAADAGYFVWPLWARDNITTEMPESLYETLSGPLSASQTVGLVRDFTGTQWLRDQDITLQARVNPALAPAQLSLRFDTNVPDAFMAGAANGPAGLWLPAFSEVAAAGFSGIVPYPRTGTSLRAGNSAGASLWNFRIPADDPKVRSVSTLGFFFTLDDGSNATNPLYAARLDVAPGAAIPADWYRRVKPFSFDIHDITKQRSNATILNNVIDPTKGERVRLSYQLEKGGQVTIQVFTLDGDLVQVLYRGNRPAGDYTASWDGKNRGGRAVARGMYFIRIVAPEIDEIRKVMVVK